MPFNLTAADQNIVSQVEMEIIEFPPIIDGFPPLGNNIIFQFPPRIISDSKDMSWTEKLGPPFWEPVARFEGSGARKVTMETVYIVTGGKFNAQNVSDILKTYKAYFYRTQGASNPTVFPTIRFKIYNHAPDNNIYWRAKGVNITHDGALINDNGTIMPLISKVSMNLELVTKINVTGEQGAGLHLVPFLPDVPSARWY